MAVGVKSADRSWQIWTNFGLSLAVDSTLDVVHHQAKLLQVFALRICNGTLSKSSNPVRSDTVAVALCKVGQTLALLCLPDPRLDLHGRINICIS